jgi:hypothetical protein
VAQRQRAQRHEWAAETHCRGVLRFARRRAVRAPRVANESGHFVGASRSQSRAAMGPAKRGVARDFIVITCFVTTCRPISMFFSDLDASRRALKHGLNFTYLRPLGGPVGPVLNISPPSPKIGAEVDGAPRALRDPQVPAPALQVSSSASCRALRARMRLPDPRSRRRIRPLSASFGAALCAPLADDPPDNPPPWRHP